MSWDSIPSELRSLRQWCLHRNKIPHRLNGEYANVNDSSSWSSFDECIAKLSVDNSFAGLGFVFTASDAYSGIDLDNPNGDSIKIARHQKVYDTFVSYAENSVSGTGVHIIVKGSVPTGVRQHGIEVYSSQRFFVFTGDVIRNEPIREYQDSLLELWSALNGERKAGNENTIINAVERDSDEQIIEKCRNADNGAKFTKLYAGEWNNDYPSQSEADFALVDIIAFYTKNRDQISRIFRASKLGSRQKAKRNDYLVGMINKSFDQTVPLIDISQFKEAFIAKASVAQLVEPAAHNSIDLGSNPSISTTLPPGLIGRLAQYIYNSAARPVWEIALGSAIATMAGICGKAYTCRNTTLNLYILVVADTGVGKEAGKDAISNLFRAIDAPLITPIASKFRGPGQIASGQAIMNYIKTNPSFVCFLGEFGLRIQTMCDPRASSTEKNLYGALLDLFGVGKGAIAENIYADKDKSTASVDGHAMSIIGDTTPDTFYSMIDESLISSGLLPRFIIFEYKGKRQYFNENKIEVPPSDLVQDIASLIAVCIGRNSKNLAVDVPLDDAAKNAMREIDVHTTDMMNDTSKGMNKALWNRAHLKIQRLAALCAIGINPHMPTIDYNCVLWASKIVYHDIELLLKKFEAGDVGKNSDVRQQNEIIRVMMHFITQPWSEMSKMDCGTQKMHANKIVSYRYINKRLSNNAAFKGDRPGDATKNITSTLKVLCDMAVIVEISTKQMKDEYGTGQKAYIITSA